jgi:toluene monooxygenase electron transfer component
MPTVTLAAGDRSFDCAAGDTVLRAGLRAGLGLPYSCNVGACGECKFALVKGAMHPYERALSALSERDIQRGRHLACQARPLGDCVAALNPEERFVPRDPPRRQNARLESIEVVTHDIACFTFRTTEPAAFRPGQYALLRPAGVSGWRPYSLSNLPNEAGVWQFMVRKVEGGEASTYLFERRALGDIVEMDGPYGVAFYRPSMPDVVCIAGGSGLSAILSIARAAAADAACKRLIFLYGGRTPRDLCARPYVEALARSGLNIAHHDIVSDLSGDASGEWSGPTGYVHEYLSTALDPSSANAQIYVAGPPPMVDAVEKALTENFSIPRERIHFDRFY